MSQKHDVMYMCIHILNSNFVLATAPFDDHKYAPMYHIATAAHDERRRWWCLRSACFIFVSSARALAAAFERLSLGFLGDASWPATAPATPALPPSCLLKRFWALAKRIKRAMTEAACSWRSCDAKPSISWASSELCFPHRICMHACWCRAEVTRMKRKGRGLKGKQNTGQVGG